VFELLLVALPLDADQRADQQRRGDVPDDRQVELGQDPS
jgi:hypothetical protein